MVVMVFFFFQAEDGIRDDLVTGVQTCALPIFSTVEEMEERQKMAAAKGDDIDIFAAYAEPPLVALNLFHLRNGQIVDRREFFWEDQHEFDEPQFFSALIKQIYIDQQHIASIIHVTGGFETLEAVG